MTVGLVPPQTQSRGRSVAVIADDLTGACDAAVQFCRDGLSPLVFVTARAVHRRPMRPAEVTAVNIDSRRGGPKAAMAAAGRCAASLAKMKARIVFHKVDSALRGHIAAELRAILDVFPGRTALIAPAFPDQRRYTVGGRQYADDQPVCRTEFRRDLFNPVTQSHIPTVLTRDGHFAPEEVSVETDPSQRTAAAAAAQTRSATVRCLVFDAVNDADLMRVARRALAHPDRYVLVGSAGLARAMARAGEGSSGFPSVGGPELVRPAMIVSGSTKQISREQIKALIGAGTRGFFFSFPPGGRVERDRVERLARAVEQCMSDGADAVLAVEDAAPATASDPPPDAVRAQIQTMFHRVISAVCTRTRPGSLILNGGDTARTVCDAAGIRILRLTGQPEPGVVSARDGDPGGHPGPIVLKSGGFGTPSTLVDLIQSR